MAVGFIVFINDAIIGQGNEGIELSTKICAAEHHQE
jgi:hypothetical protein